MSQYTIFHELHVARNARLVDFSGWEMPLNYAPGAVAEHKLVRSSAGIFDISHMGRFLVHGDSATSKLESLCTARLADLQVGGARYSLLTDDEGSVLDDLFLYRLLEHRWLVVANASNRAVVLDHLRDRSSKAMEIDDVSESMAMVAVQGPSAVRLAASTISSSLVDLPRAAITTATWGTAEILAARTGYTGEDGFEFFVPRSAALAFWEAIESTAAGENIPFSAIGLAARDSLRFEAGMPLYGHEISRQRGPVEAGLSWACDLAEDGHDFPGKRKLQLARAGQKLKTAALVVENAVPREGFRVFDEEGTDEVGVVTSGMFCPSAGVFAANALIPVELATIDRRLTIEIRGRKILGRIVKRPLYRPTYR